MIFKFLLFVIGIIVFATSPLSKKERNLYQPKDFFSLRQETIQQAQKTGEIKICDQSPIELDVFTENELSGPSGSPQEIRSRCYFAFMRTFHDVRACEAIRELEKDNLTTEKSWNCYKYLAEISEQPIYCEQAPSIYEKNQCLANVTRTLEPCFAMPLSEYDTSKYSRGVAECLHGVALRKRDSTICLQIDSDDYGHGWQRERNACLLQIASLTKTNSSKLPLVCEALSWSEEEARTVQECNKGNLMWHQAEELIPSSLYVKS